VGSEYLLKHIKTPDKCTCELQLNTCQCLSGSSLSFDLTAGTNFCPCNPPVRNPKAPDLSTAPFLPPPRVWAAGNRQRAQHFQLYLYRLSNKHTHTSTQVQECTTHTYIHTHTCNYFLLGPSHLWKTPHETGNVFYWAVALMQVWENDRQRKSTLTKSKVMASTLLEKKNQCSSI